MRKCRLGDPHFGQNLAFSRDLLNLLFKFINFFDSPFCLRSAPKSLNLNSSALLPHRGHICPFSSCLSNLHFVFGHIDGVIRGST